MTNFFFGFGHSLGSVQGWPIPNGSVGPVRISMGWYYYVTQTSDITINMSYWFLVLGLTKTKLWKRFGQYFGSVKLNQKVPVTISTHHPPLAHVDLSMYKYDRSVHTKVCWHDKGGGRNNRIEMRREENNSMPPCWPKFFWNPGMSHIKLILMTSGFWIWRSFD